MPAKRMHAETQLDTLEHRAGWLCVSVPACGQSVAAQLTTVAREGAHYRAHMRGRTTGRTIQRPRV